MDYRDNLEIDIIDLCKSVFVHWKIMILFALLGAIIIGGYGYYKSAMTINSDTGELYIGASVSEYDSLRKDLTAGDISLIEATANQYLGYVKEYVDLIEYGKNSVYLNLNAQNTSMLTRCYAIKENSENMDKEDDSTPVLIIDGSNLYITDYASNISTFYNAGLRDSETINIIREAIGVDVDDGAINDLFTINVSGRNVLCVNCIGTDKEMCEKMISILDSRIEELTPIAQETYDFELNYLNEYYYNGKNDAVDSEQKDYNSYLHTLRVNMNTLNSIIPSEQKGYYNYLIGIVNETFMSDAYLNGDIYDGERIDTADIGSITDLVPREEVVEQVNTKVVRSLNIKYIAIGFAIGAFAVAFIIVIMYVMSGKLHTSDDLRDSFGISVIGEIADKSDVDRLNIITSGISIAASKMNASKIALIGAARDMSADEVRNAIAKIISGKSEITSCEICNDVLNSPVDMESLADADVAVMVEKKDLSKYENIARELELCNKYGVKVLGAVMMK